MCLFRSCLSKINTTKGRKNIVPVEIESEHYQRIFPKNLPIVVKQILQKALEDNDEFSELFKPVWFCNICHKKIQECDDIFLDLESLSTNGNRNVKYLFERKLDNLHNYHMLHKDDGICQGEKRCCVHMSEEQTTMIFTSSAMDIDLKEQITIGSNNWHCVSMISKTGQILFEYGDKWYNSSNLNEVITMYHSNVVLAVYEKNNILLYEDQPYSM